MTSHPDNADPKRQPSPDIANALVALKRAARRAREDARRTGVPVIYMKDGKIVEEPITDHAHPDDLDR